jgi:hypothetical protein
MAQTSSTLARFFLEKIPQLSQFFTTVVGICLVLFFGNLCLKSIQIASAPPLLTNDETYYATEAQAILTNGTDITGRWHPWQLAPANPIYSELTGLTLLPGFLVFPQSTQLAMKVIPVLMGSLLPVLLGLISYKLFKQKVFLVTTGLIATANPWLFQFSRMSFDSLPSVFFYCLGIVITLYAKGWKLLWALAPFCWGFFQYQGHKPLLIPIVVLSLSYVLTSEVTNLKQLWHKKFLPHLTIVLISCLLVGSYLVRLPQLSSSVRISEFAINPATVSREVETQRRLSFTHFALPLFENKATVVLQQLTQRFFASFDLVWLFQKGNDQIDSFAVTQFGFLYGIDAILILVACYLLIFHQPWRLAGGFLAGLTLISTLSNLLKSGSTWLTFRGSFTIVALVLLSSVALSFIWSQKKLWLTGIVCLTYFLSVLAFAHHYFFSYPLLATKDLAFYHRVIANYAVRNPNRELVIYSANAKFLFDGIIAYNNRITTTTLPKLAENYQQKNYQLDSITLKDTCLDLDWVATQSGITVLSDYRVAPCNPLTPQIATASGLQNKIVLSSPIDSGGIYTLYGDTLCLQTPLQNYINITKNIFNLEAISDQAFCQAFFTRAATQ